MSRVKFAIGCLLIIAFGGMLMSGLAAGAKEPMYKGITLTLSSHRGPSTAAYEKLIPEFEEKFGAKVIFEIGPYGMLRAKHFTEAAAHTGVFDVISFPHVELGAYVQGEVIRDLNPYLQNPALADPEYDIQDFVPFVLDAYGLYDSGRYALPYKFDVFIAMFRKDLFLQYGLTSPGFFTYEVLLEVAEKLAPELEQGIYPVVLPLKSPVASFTPWASVFISNGGTFFDENKYPLFHQKAGVDSLNYLKKLLPFMPPDVASYDFDVANNAFAQGKAVYSINWHAYFPTVLDPNESVVYDQVGFVVSPKGRSRQAQQLGGWAVGISLDSRNPEAAFQLVQFLTSKKNAVQFALNGGASARTSVAENAEVVAKIPYYPLLIKALELAFRKPNDPSWPASQDFMGVAVGNALIGKDAASELTMAARKAYAEVQKFGYSPQETDSSP